MKSGSVSAEIANPYAEALMSLAKANNLTDRMGDDTRFLLELLESSQDLKKFLVNPLISTDKKKATLRQILADRIHAYTLNFVMLLLDRKRIVFLEDMCEVYLDLLRDLKQTVLAKVTSAVELNDEQKQSVRNRVLAMTQARDVELQTYVDPSLLGGMVVEVGSQFIDASVRGQLRRLAFSMQVA